MKRTLQVYLNKRVLKSILCGIVFINGSFAFAQIETVKTRKFKTTYKITMYTEADFHSPKIKEIPANVILQSLEETERYGGYIKVFYKNKTGWVLKAETERYMDVPASEIIFESKGYKIIGDVYRYFFFIRNDGTLAYSGTTTLRLFDKDDKVVFEKTVDASTTPLNPATGGVIPIDLRTEALRFEFEFQGGKIKGVTGQLIERIPN